MARSLRIEYPNAFHHVINRGYMKMKIFHDDKDYERFLDDLNKVFHSHNLVVHAFCLMPNHFHLFTETPSANLQKAMHRLQSRYASYYKKKYEHSNKVFERRYKAYLVDSDIYALDLTRYIHRNPLEKLVNDPAAWAYSSYRFYVTNSPQPDFLHTELILDRFDTNKDWALVKIKQHMGREDSSKWHPEDYILGKSIIGAKPFLERIKEFIPDELNTEIAGLIKLSEDQKAQMIKQFTSTMDHDIETQINLTLFGLRIKTYLNTDEINSLLGFKLSTSAIHRRVRRLKNRSKKELKLAKSMIKIQSLQLFLKG